MNSTLPNARRFHTQIPFESEPEPSCLPNLTYTQTLAVIAPLEAPGRLECRPGRDSTQRPG